MRFDTNTRELCVLGLTTASLCLLAPFSLPLPGMVPISLATLALYFAGYLLKARQASVCCALYLLLGAVGLPVFSGFTGGLSRLAGPTGGYMIGYFAIAAIHGLAVWRFPESRRAHVTAMAIGTAICYLTGTIWLCFLQRISFISGLAVGVLPFIAGDVAKIAAAAAIGPVIRKRLISARLIIPDNRQRKGSGSVS